MKFLTKDIKLTLVLIVVGLLASFGVAKALGSGGSFQQGASFFKKADSDTIVPITASTTIGDANNRVEAVFGKTGDFNTALFSNIDTSGCGTFSGSATSTICGDGSESVIGADLKVSGTTKLKDDLVVENTSTFNSRVGIGTASPETSLEVVGQNSDNEGVIFKSSDGDNHSINVVAGSGQNSSLQLKSESGSGWNLLNANTRVPSAFTLTDLDNLTIPFLVERGADSDTFVLTSQGDIGVRTQNPDANLDVLGNNSNNVGIITEADNGGSQAIKIKSGGASQNAFLRFENGDNSNFWNFTSFFSTSGNNFGITNSNGTPIYIHNQADSFSIRVDQNGNTGLGNSSPNNRLTVDGNADVTGNLGIGTTNPSTALDVNGKASFNDDHSFYGSMTTSSNSNTTTINSQNTYVELNIYNEGETRDITFSNSDLNINTTGTYKVDLDGSLQAENNQDTFELSLFVNGTERSAGTCRTRVPNSGFDNCSQDTLQKLNSGDTVDVRIRNLDGNGNVTVEESNITVTQL
jgi:hypothetical protein